MREREKIKITQWIMEGITSGGFQDLADNGEIALYPDETIAVRVPSYKAPLSPEEEEGQGPNRSQLGTTPYTPGQDGG